MSLPFLEWALYSLSYTVEVVIKLMIILKWTEKNLASRRKIEVSPNDAPVMGIN